NWKRAQSDYKMSVKTKKIAHRELPSMERGDMAKKVKEAKKRVKFESDENVKHKDLYEYLDKLIISSYPVNFSFHREELVKAKFEYEKAKLDIVTVNQKDLLAKTQALNAIEEKKDAYTAAIDTYERNRRVTSKLNKTYRELMRINAKRVMKTIHHNAYAAYKEFKTKHLMFTENKELDNYLSGFGYTHWDVNFDLTRTKVVSMYKDWQRKAERIRKIRAKSHAINIDRCIQRKNASMYRYWVKHYDLDILRCYKKEDSLSEYEARHNRAINLFKRWQNDQSEIYQVADKSDIDNLDKLIQEKNRAMFTYWWNHYDLKILNYYKKEKKLFETAIRHLNKKNHERSDAIYRDGGSK
ncbi:MAG: hypothetical protein MJ208_04110, partial [Bacilli bacterium]|nr:hypothetical protein [Bacilli bacterium]